MSKQPAKNLNDRFRPKAPTAGLRDETLLDDETRRSLMKDIENAKYLKDQVTSSSALAPKSNPNKEGGAGGGGGEGSEDLLGVMCKRLQALEKKNHILQLELKEKNRDVISLTDNLAHERSERRKAISEKEELVVQLEEIHAFLAEYGLTWVGDDGRTAEGENPRALEKATECANLDAHQTTAPPAKKFDMYAGTVDVQSITDTRPKMDAPLPQPGELQVSNAPAERIGPVSVMTNLPFNISALERNAESLTANCGFTGVTDDGEKRKIIKEKDTIEVCIYSDGICVNNGPFRPYGWPLCDAFLGDLLDGYYPYEFKDRFPDGFPMRIVDQSTIVCPKNSAATSSGSENITGLEQQKKFGYKPISKQSLLSKLPKQYITPSGLMVNVQDDVNLFLGGPGRSGSGGESGGQQQQRPVSRGHLAPAKDQKSSIGEYWKNKAAAGGDVGGGSPNFMSSVSGGTVIEPTHAMGNQESRTASIQVRMPEGQRVVLHMRYDDTIGVLYQEFTKATASFFSNGGGGLELCTILPRVPLMDKKQTLESAGLVPHCTLGVKVGK